MIAETRLKQLKVEEQERVLLRDISWKTFEALIQELEAQPNKRLTYEDGLLEIWMPLALHERYKKFLARLIEILTMESGIEICSLGSCTWRRQDLTKSVEADECYYIQNEPAIRNRLEIDLAVDPPPDLAVEVNITSLSLSRLAIHGALGVPEVWQFNGKTLTFLQLEAGTYQPIERSIALPIMTIENTTLLIRKTQEMSETAWARWVQHWVKEQLSER